MSRLREEHQEEMSRLREEHQVELSWEATAGTQIANEHYRLRVDPARGGGVSSLIDLGSGAELIADGRVGNELAVYEEYPSHPKAGEGPWHLLPKGPVVGSSAAAASSVQSYRGPLGQRLVIGGRIGGLLRYTQTVTLWHGVARVDCQTTIDEFTGEDRLLRLRWPCPVPGALPVSEVGDAVVGRGFGLLHDPSDRSGRSVDTERYPWTLENPAYSWFGLSSAVRIRVGAHVHAVSVAEVVSPTEAASAPLARDLMVALVRAGVTATCSTADRSRYGNLEVDSNLPDTRIALGGPGQNTFTAAVLAGADPAYTEELRAQLHATGRAAVWVPAAVELAEVWVPGADLRSPRALPVLVIAGADLDGAVAVVVEDLDDAEIVLTQRAAAGQERFEPRTVALLNRGVPSFAVDPDRTLHTSLMRSCTGWPSGTWIDPPRRTAPDGSNFQLQHWTHTFDYAVASGDGDWRRAGIPARSAEFSHPLLAVVDTDRHAAELGSAGSLFEMDAAGSAALGALKAAGNPLAGGSGQPVDPGVSVAIRLVETCGRRTGVVVRCALGTLSEAVRADLLEMPRQEVDYDLDSGPDGLALTLHGYEIATVLARLDVPQVFDATAAPLAPEAEAAQPLYARYWLHNRGPAPLGGLPAVAHLHPQHVDVEPGAEVLLRLTAASDCGDSPLLGTVSMVCPKGWSATLDELPFELASGGHLETDVVLRMPPGTTPGRYPVRVQLAVTGTEDDLPASWRQVVEDVCVVSVGSADGEVLRLISGPAEVEIAAGATARLGVTVGTDALADLAVEAHLISPWGTWEWLGPAAVGAVLPAAGTVDIGFVVAPPAWVEPGEWWALVRVACAGRLVYSPAVKVTVR
jgi:alpha-mannosidase